MLHRHLPHEQVVAGLAAALDVGALTAEAVALRGTQTRRHDDDPVTESGEELTEQPTPPAPAVRSLTEHRLRTHLPTDTRPLPTVDKYDQLLPSRHDTHHEGASP
jgi:hypothetical protein